MARVRRSIRHWARPWARSQAGFFLLAYRIGVSAAGMRATTAGATGLALKRRTFFRGMAPFPEHSRLTIMAAFRLLAGPQERRPLTGFIIRARSCSAPPCYRAGITTFAALRSI